MRRCLSPWTLNRSLTACAIAVCVLGAAARADQPPIKGLTDVTHERVQLRGGFWGSRQKTHHEVTIPHALDCLEADGHPEVDIFRSVLPQDTDLRAEHRPELLGGVTVPRGEVLAEGQQPVALTAVPYYAWCNREKGPMTVWIDEASATPNTNRLDSEVSR